MLLLVTQSSALSFNRKILLLPGSCSSAGAFLNMASGSAPLIGAAKATYHDGGRLAWLFEAVDPQTSSGEWFCPGGQGEGAEESIAAVEAALDAGGFAGLVGFDDGAALASLVAARAALGEGCTGLQFAVMCSSTLPKPNEALLHRLRDSPDARLLPTLHCLSKAGTAGQSAQGEALAACFPSAELMWHEGGHAMPPRDRLKSVVQFFERSWSGGKGRW